MVNTGQYWSGHDTGEIIHASFTVSCANTFVTNPLEPKCANTAIVNVNKNEQTLIVPFLSSHRPKIKYVPDTEQVIWKKQQFILR